ncbi:hypothetical protein P692DRAFT_20104417 [Suillus brevipes Sb2]|nr:hypothetical protein P692DRAFT_20104417 [Suillus brevipes Sb2]
MIKCRLRLAKLWVFLSVSAALSPIRSHSIRSHPRTYQEPGVSEGAKYSDCRYQPWHPRLSPFLMSLIATQLGPGNPSYAPVKLGPESRCLTLQLE